MMLQMWVKKEVGRGKRSRLYHGRILEEIHGRILGDFEL